MTKDEIKSLASKAKDKVVSFYKDSEGKIVAHKVFATVVFSFIIFMGLKAIF